MVIGDRNQKNQTVQSKRKGKLVEMTVSEMQILIWKSWPQNPYKQYVRIQSLTVEQVFLFVTMCLPCSKKCIDGRITLAVHWTQTPQGEHCKPVVWILLYTSMCHIRLTSITAIRCIAFPSPTFRARMMPLVYNRHMQMFLKYSAIRVHMQLVKSYGLLTGLGQVHPNLERMSYISLFCIQE